MRVLLNGTPLLSSRSGVGNYVYFLGEALLRVASQHEWKFHYLAFQSSRIRPLPVSFLGGLRSKMRDVPGMYMVYRRVLETLFRLNTWRKGIDLYHETNYAPFPFEGATVVTVYDLSFFYYPDTHPKERVKFYERNFFPRLPGVNHFVTISESVKGEMVRDLKISPDRITVTPLGLDAQYAPAPSEKIVEVLAKFGLSAGRYVISVGTREPRKNLHRLLEAYALISPVMRDRFPLVVVGGGGWLVEDWAPLLKRWGLTKNVRTLGYVLQEHLPVLYSGAALMAYPSLYEGFGLPPLEAMGCGCPVLTSNLSSLPEVVGEAACKVDPLNVQAISEQLVRLLSDAPCRDRMRTLGLRQAGQFHWDRCARLTLQAYGKALGQGAKE